MYTCVHGKHPACGSEDIVNGFAKPQRPWGARGREGLVCRLLGGRVEGGQRYIALSSISLVKRNKVFTSSQCKEGDIIKGQFLIYIDKCFSQKTCPPFSLQSLSHEISLFPNDTSGVEGESQFLLLYTPKLKENIFLTNCLYCYMVNS